MALPKILYLGCFAMMLAIIVVEAKTPPGIAKNPARASCKMKKYKMCYNLEHVCPKFCPDSCEVECASCKPICSPGSSPPPPPTDEGSPPPSDSEDGGKKGGEEDGEGGKKGGDKDDKEGEGGKKGGEDGDKGGKKGGDGDGDGDEDDEGGKKGGDDNEGGKKGGDDKDSSSSPPYYPPSPTTPTPSIPSPPTPSSPPTQTPPSLTPPSTPTPTPSTPSSSPPSNSSGVSPRKKVRCNNKSYGQCYNQEYVCPASCPTSCQVDCSSCKPVCSCDYPGAVCQDPRFIGGDGITFYFHGKKDQDFCLVTDHDLHINAHFIGKRNQNMGRDFTWVQSIGILFDDNHRLFIGAKKTSTWDDANDRLSLAYDGEPITLEQTLGYEWRSKSSTPQVTITRTNSETNNIIVEVQGKLKITTKVVPITKEDSRVHNYGITNEDCFAHLDLGFKFESLTEKVDGVLGKTYRDDYVSKVNVGAPMAVVGGEREYASSNIFATDCLASRFNVGHHNDDESSLEALELANINCSSGVNGEAGMVCKR